jgi:hypothetical protein
MRLAYLPVVSAACYTSPAPASLSNQSAHHEPAGLTISRTHFGPLGRDTPALLVPLRRALLGYEVRPVHDNGLEYDIFQGGERIAYVVIDEDGESIFNVHAVSSKVRVADREWRVGAKFRSAGQLTDCECWGENPTCYKKGDHVAVNFDRACAELASGDPAALLRLDGERVARLIWSPSPFGAPEVGGDPGPP